MFGKYSGLLLLSAWMMALLLPHPAHAQYGDPGAVNDILQQGSEAIVVNELLLDERFDDVDAWEFYEDDDASAFVRNGVYYMDRTEPSTTMWAQNNTLHDDVVMVFDARQINTNDDNAFGMMCRADPANNAGGYHLRISGDGFATIGVNRGQGIDFLVEWTPTTAVNQGQQLNRVMVVCVGDYLALYANGELIMETRDDTFSTGVAGFSIANYVDGANVQVEFDNLEIYSASSDGASTGTRAGNGIRIVPRGTTSEDQDSADPVATEEALPPPPPAEVDFIVANRALANLTTILTANDSPIRLGNVISTATFDDEQTTPWEIIDFKDETVLFTTKVIGGRYVVYSEGTGAGINEWAIDLQNVHDDAVIVLSTEQISAEDDNGFGVICRADLTNTGDGYYFRISGDGFYSVVIVQDGAFEFLQDWTRSPVINQGQNVNELVAVCVGDYLAFYINGVLMGEFTDTTYQRGTVGVNIVGYSEGQPTEIAFSEIVVVEARR